MSSDVDLVVLALDPSAYVNDDSWVESAVGELAPLVRTMTWGTVTERRVRLASGLEVEFGFAPLSWASTAPLDPGSAQVVSGGCQAVTDPDSRLAHLIRAVSATQA